MALDKERVESKAFDALAGIVSDMSLTEDRVRAEMKSSKVAGTGLEKLAKTPTGADAIRYMLQCIQHYDDLSKGFKALALAQELRKMLKVLDKAGCENAKPVKEDLHALLITSRELAHIQPSLDNVVYQRVTDNLEVIRYGILARDARRGMTAPTRKGIRFWYDLSDGSSCGSSESEVGSDGDWSVAASQPEQAPATGTVHIETARSTSLKAQKTNSIKMIESTTLRTVEPIEPTIQTEPLPNIANAKKVKRKRFAKFFTSCLFSGFAGLLRKRKNRQRVEDVDF